MAGMIRSIFGLTTEDVRQKQLEQQQEMAAQLQEQQGTSPFAATFGIGFGAGLGRGLMSRLGFEDPEMAKAKEVEAAQTALDEQLAGLELDDPQRLYLIGQALIEAGKPEEATRYFALAKQFETGKEELGLRKEELGLRREQMEDTEASRAASLYASMLNNIYYTPEEINKTVRTLFPNVKLPEVNGKLPKIEEQKSKSESNKVIEWF